jgi:putative membrane protein
MVMKKSATFFSDEEKNRIEKAIQKVEAKSSGEIVAMVVDQSGHYRDTELLAGIIMSAAASVFPADLIFAYSSNILARFLPSLAWASSVPVHARFMAGLAVFIMLTIVLAFPARAVVSRISALRKFFISDGRMERETRDRAIRAFHEKGLSNTRDATGVLFLVSVFERKVYVLADHGIYSKISQSVLDRYAASVARGIAKKRGCDALVEAIDAMGADLAAHFPVKPDDINELADRVLTE